MATDVQQVTGNVSLSIAPDLSPVNDTLAIITGRTMMAVSYLSTNFTSTVLDWTSGNDISIEESGCEGTCYATLPVSIDDSREVKSSKLT